MKDEMKTNPSCDFISRADAIEAIASAEPKDNEYHYYKHFAIKILSEIPSAEAVQGEWGHMIAHGMDGSHWYEYECSHCGGVVLRPYNFCPNCGTMMYKDGDDTTGGSL